MLRIGLVGCGSSKLPHPAPARELYTGGLFRKASTYAEATCEAWFVLSARHHLVAPDQVIEPYDAKLGNDVTLSGTHAARRPHPFLVVGRHGGCVPVR